MATPKSKVKNFVHFQCKGVTDFVEVENRGAIWVLFAGEHMAYSVMQCKIKSTVHSVILQFGFDWVNDHDKWSRAGGVVIYMSAVLI